MTSTSPVICIVPRLNGLGGMVSFQAKLIAGLSARGIENTFDIQRKDITSLLVIGGISRLPDLIRARRRGVRVVQRLNGMNWIHRKRPTGLKHYLRAEWNNWVLSTIRRSLADHIVYQSQFARTWWQTVYGTTHANHQVTYNGVDLSAYTPDGPAERPNDRQRVLLVEGHLGGGNEEGLMNAIELVRLLNLDGGARYELQVVGDVPDALRPTFEALAPGQINWAGVVRREQIPTIDRSAHLLFSADLNAACPNAVIEALACGLPVVSFATGALPELVADGAGRVVPYGSNYWNLESPDVPALAAGAREVLADLERFRQGARARAEAEFGLDHMVEQYLSALLG